MNQHTKKCKCGSHNGMACKNCSRIKMVFMLTHKFKNETAVKTNPVVYSKIKRNNWTNTKIVEEMKTKVPVLNAFKEYAQNCNCIIFYDRETNQEIEKYKP